MRYSLILEQLKESALIKKMVADLNVEIKPRIDPK
jgi:hypothetical protein